MASLPIHPDPRMRFAGKGASPVGPAEVHPVNSQPSVSGGDDQHHKIGGGSIPAHTEAGDSHPQSPFVEEPGDGTRPVTNE